MLPTRYALAVIAGLAGAGFGATVVCTGFDPWNTDAEVFSGTEAGAFTLLGVFEVVFCVALLKLGELVSDHLTDAAMPMRAMAVYMSRNNLFFFLRA